MNFRSSFLEDQSNAFRIISVGLTGLAQLDCLISLSCVAKRVGFCRPRFTDDGNRRMRVADGRNIIVEQFASADRQYVANDVDVGDDGKALLLTGPNMGGKSCYLRQVTEGTSNTF